jgi:hypothetical protein
VDIEIIRNGNTTTHPFTDYFKGFAQIETVQRIFGKQTEAILNNLRVEFLGAAWAYMAVSDLDGHLIISVDSQRAPGRDHRHHRHPRDLHTAHHGIPVAHPHRRDARRETPSMTHVALSRWVSHRTFMCLLVEGSPG